MGYFIIRFFNHLCDRVLIIILVHKDKSLSLKENVKAIKEELNTEEQFLESVIKAEGFWKKYKTIVIVLAALAFLAVVGKMVMGYMHESSMQKSNEAYSKLLKNGDDADALASLKGSNPKLYEMFMFQKSVKTTDVKELEKLQSSLKDPVLKDLVSYQIDSISQKDLSSYATKEGSIIKEFALYESAYLLLKQNKIKEATTKLDQIQKTSPLFNMAQSLKHYSGN